MRLFRPLQCVQCACDRETYNTSACVCLPPLHKMPAVQLPSAQHPVEEEARVRPSDSLHSHRKNDAETHAEEKEGEGEGEIHAAHTEPVSRSGDDLHLVRNSLSRIKL